MSIDLMHLFEGILRLLIIVSMGSFLGIMLDESGLLNRVQFLLKPLMKVAGISATSASAVVAAFGSARVANTMIATACDNGEITQREMIRTAMIISFPAVLLHMRINAFILIPLLGWAGISYIGMQFCAGLVTAIAASLFFREIKDDSYDSDTIFKESKKVKEGTLFKRSYLRSRKIVLRIIKITVPCYIIVFILENLGIFKKITLILPSFVSNFLSAESMTIIGTHFSSVHMAASAASAALKEGSLTNVQVFITLTIGYLLTIPIRVIKHTLPAALGIFPKKSGLIIVSLSQSIRIVVAISIIIATLIWYK